METREKITWVGSITRAVLSIIAVALLFLVATMLLEPKTAEGGTYKEKIYKGVNSEIFDPNTVVYSSDAYKKIVSPDKSWYWLNSWHIVHRQPGAVIRTARGFGGYTLTNSFDPIAAEELTWAHYSFFLFVGNLPEEYDPVRPAEDRIWKELKQSVRVIRIDKLSPNFYVVAYTRSDHKKFELEEVDGYPPFNLGDNVGITNDGITGAMKVKSFDPYGRTIFTLHPFKIFMDNVILLNPTFFQNPTELQTIFIPYKFFGKKKGFLYQHSGVAELHRQSGGPVFIEITMQGVNIKFRKPVEYEVLNY